MPKSTGFSENCAERNVAGVVSEAEEHKIWCSVGEAVTRLAEAGDKISQQALTKYLDKFAEIPRRPSEADARVTLVDFEALAKHRAENPRNKGVEGAKRGGRRNSEAEQMRLRERKAIVELREFQLAERKGELVTRAEVLRAMSAASVALTQAFQRTRYERAEALEAAPDARAKAALLIEQDEAIQAAFADALGALTGAGATHDGEREGESDAGGGLGDENDGANSAEAA